MKRGTVLAQLAVFGVISILIISYTVFELLGVRITNRPFSMTVQLHDAGGIFEDAEVTFRGVAVGRVDAMKLHTDGVTLTLSINHGTKIPDNSAAHVSDLSAVGEQYVNLVPPKQPSSTYFHSGSVVPADRTTTPLETATVLFDLEQFVDSISPKDISIIGREGAAAFSGTGPQLKSILSNATDLINQLSDTTDSTLDLLKNASTLLHGAAEHAGDFDTFTSSLQALSSTLASSTPTIEKFLQDGAPTTELINDVIRENGDAISVLLADGASISQIQVARIPGLRSLLVAVPRFGELAPHIVKNGSLQGIGLINRTQPVCSTGVPLSDPLSGTRTPLHAVNCSGLPRGAENAPRPGGSASAQSAASTLLAASAQTTPSGAAQVGTYDASDGVASTASGGLIRFGTNGGQDTYLGKNSWQALLLAGTGS